MIRVMTDPAFVATYGHGDRGESGLDSSEVEIMEGMGPNDLMDNMEGQKNAHKMSAIEKKAVGVSPTKPSMSTNSVLPSEAAPSSGAIGRHALREAYRRHALKTLDKSSVVLVQTTQTHPSP